MKYAIMSDAHAIFDSSAANVCVRRLPFDFQSYITEMLKNDLALPDWLVAILLRAQAGREKSKKKPLVKGTMAA